MPPRFAVHAPAKPTELAVVSDGLDEYNRGRIPRDAVQPLHVIASDEDGAIFGGAIGRTWGACCELRELWVASDRRGLRHGTKLLDAFEREALRRGCEIVYLDTFSFQAPDFYVKRGYVEVLRTAGFTGGAEKITMQKRLLPPDALGCP